jgi:hypothetical protein
MPMDKKLQQELKFRIGEQYGKYEFELDWVTSVLDNNLRYEVYKYIGKDKNSVFNFEIHKILMAYNCDFLASFYYIFKSSSNPSSIIKTNENTGEVKSRKIIKLIQIEKGLYLLSITKRNCNLNIEEILQKQAIISRKNTK